MLTPTQIENKTSCLNLVNNLLHSESEFNQEEAMTELAASNFKNSTDYTPVYKNFDYNKTYDTWIYEGNEKDKIVGYKYIQSYPYSTPEFKIGDYIHWNFDHTRLSTWLIISLDTQHLYNVKGRMLQCNNSLKWKDKKGEINCYPCVIEDSMTYTNFKWGNKGIVQNGGDIVVLVQRNKDTEKIGINDRFLFNEVSFRVKQYLNELNPDYLELYMMKAPELNDDNFKDNLAINEQPKEKVKLEGDIILPDIQEIQKGKLVSFSVYNYIKGRKQEDTFSVNITGAPEKYYKLTIIDENNFVVENLLEYQINPINIECTNNTSGEKVSKKIWLGGNW